MKYVFPEYKENVVLGNGKLQLNPMSYQVIYEGKEIDLTPREFEVLYGEDSKISCTKMRLLKKIELRSLLLHGAAYMAKYPNRKWNSHVAKENGTSCNGFCIVRGKGPKAKGQKGDLLLLLKEQPGNSQILEIGVICIDGQKYPEETWIDVTGKLVEL